MKVSIIGASGRVGKNTAFCLAEENVIDELVLISRKGSIDKVKGESRDIYDALAAKGIDVLIKPSSDLEDIRNSDIVVLAAGIPRKPHMLRMDLGVPNAKIVAKYSKEIAKFSPDSIIFVITNPVDIMTYVAFKTSGFEKNRVFGLGTHLDSMRLKNQIAKHFNVHVSEVHTRIIGEHGNGMVPLISSTSIGGIPIKHLSDYKTFNIEEVIKKVQKAGSSIIAKKGATEYGPAFAILNIVNTILNDEKRILTVSAYLDGEIEGLHDVCLGAPVKLGSRGIEEIIPIKMDENEKQSFINAANTIKNATIEIIGSVNNLQEKIDQDL